MNDRKGLILAGGTGSRLWPVTLAVSKQLLPIHDKPMIYYPLAVLMLSDIRDIAIITTAKDQAQFQSLLGDGTQWGLNITYLIQKRPEGIAQAYVVADEYLNGCNSVLVLGDNLFFGHGLQEQLKKACNTTNGATVFGYQVADASRYGVVGFNDCGNANSIEEKPAVPLSNYAVTGLYFTDGSAPERVKSVKSSERNELEITDLLLSYLNDQALDVQMMSRGYTWLDTGTHESLLEASNFVRTLQHRQGLQVGSPDEIAFNNGWISADDLDVRSNMFANSDYGAALKRILERS